MSVDKTIVENGGAMLNSKAYHYAQLVQITEKACLDGCEDHLKSMLAEHGYTHHHTLYVSQLANMFDSSLGKELMFGFIAESKMGEIVCSLRCTSTKLEALQDALFLPIPSPIAGTELSTVATGFLSLYRSLRVGKTKKSDSARDALVKLANRNKNVVISGHSLGGAIATFLGYDFAQNTQCLPPSVYTYGSPRVGDVLFANAYNKAPMNSYRVVVAGDPVTLVPILPAYKHVESEAMLYPPKNTIKSTGLCRHHISTYLHVLSLQTPGVDVYPLDEDCKVGSKQSWWQWIKSWFGG